MTGAVAMAAMMAAAPAMAAPATVTIAGTVMSGADAGGIFGTAGASLAGLPFSAIFLIEPRTGSQTVATVGGSYLSGRGAASPVTAAFTIGGRTYDFTGALGGSARVDDRAGRGGTDLVQYMVEDTITGAPVNTLLQLGFDTVRDVLSRPDFTSYGPLDLTLADNAKGQVRIANRNADGSYGAATYGDLAVTRISAANAVPEPATWGLMLAGFAATGVALRRRGGRARLRTA